MDHVVPKSHPSFDSDHAVRRERLFDLVLREPAYPVRTAIQAFVDAYTDDAKQASILLHLLCALLCADPDHVLKRIFRKGASASATRARLIKAIACMLHLVACISVTSIRKSTQEEVFKCKWGTPTYYLSGANLADASMMQLIGLLANSLEPGSVQPAKYNVGTGMLPTHAAHTIRIWKLWVKVLPLCPFVAEAFTPRGGNHRWNLLTQEGGRFLGRAAATVWGVCYGVHVYGDTHSTLVAEALGTVAQLPVTLEADSTTIVMTEPVVKEARKLGLTVQSHGDLTSREEMAREMLVSLHTALNVYVSEFAKFSISIAKVMAIPVHHITEECARIVSIVEGNRGVMRECVRAPATVAEVPPPASSPGGFTMMDAMVGMVQSGVEAVRQVVGLPAAGAWGGSPPPAPTAPPAGNGLQVVYEEGASVRNETPDRSSSEEEYDSDATEDEPPLTPTLPVPPQHSRVQGAPPSSARAPPTPVRAPVTPPPAPRSSGRYNLRSRQRAPAPAAPSTVSEPAPVSGASGVTVVKLAPGAGGRCEAQTAKGTQCKHSASHRVNGKEACGIHTRMERSCPGRVTWVSQ